MVKLMQGFTDLPYYGSTARTSFIFEKDYKFGFPGFPYTLFNRNIPKSMSVMPGMVFFAHSVASAVANSVQGTGPSNSCIAIHLCWSGNFLINCESTDLVAIVYLLVLRYPGNVAISLTRSPRYHSSSFSSSEWFIVAYNNQCAGPMFSQLMI